MIAIGLTGGIGAGKSVVSQCFQALGVPVYDADVEARRLTESDQGIRDIYRKLFGPDAFIEGKLDRGYVAKEAFKDPSKLQSLNAVIHPAVALDYSRWLTKQSGVYHLREAALIFETGMSEQLEATILVSAPTDLRIERVLQRDPHRDREQVVNIINKQLPEAEKRQRSQYIIENDGHHMVIPQVLKIHHLLLGK